MAKCLYIFLLIGLLSIITKAQVDKIESIEGKISFNPNVIQSRMYDYSTSTIAFKDKPTKKCYIQRMQKKVPVPLYISDSKSDKNEVEILAGSGIARFCQGLDVYKLLVQVK